jgi:hypothetical protein
MEGFCLVTFILGCNRSNIAKDDDDDDDHMVFQVFIAMTVKVTFLWNVRPYSLIDFHTCFGGILCLHLRRKRGSVLIVQEIRYFRSRYVYQSTRPCISEDSNLIFLIIIGRWLQV